MFWACFDVVNIDNDHDNDQNDQNDYKGSSSIDQILKINTIRVIMQGGLSIIHHLIITQSPFNYWICNSTDASVRGCLKVWKDDNYDDDDKDKDVFWCIGACVTRPERSK